MMPTSEPFPGETLIADGWVYMDLPRMKQKVMDDFLELVGKGNYRFLTLASYGRVSDPDVRGQVLISPTGIEAIRRRKALSQQEQQP